MSKYKPMLVHFDETSYNSALAKAEQKNKYFNEAIQWIQQYDMNPKGEQIKEFHESFSNYFRTKIAEKHKDSIGITLSAEKILDLLDIKIADLIRLEKLYKEIDIPCEFNTTGDETIQYPVDEKQFQIFTKSSEQNQKLRDFRNFIDALEKLSEHCHVYPHQIQIGTSGFVRYDMRSSTYLPNLFDR